VAPPPPDFLVTEIYNPRRKPPPLKIFVHAGVNLQWLMNQTFFCSCWTVSWKFKCRHNAAWVVRVINSTRCYLMMSGKMSRK